MSYCKRIKGILLSLDFRMGFTTLVRISCKQWNCPCCSQKNARNWRAYLLEKFNHTFLGMEHWCFITITAHRKAHITPLMTIKNLQQVWKRLYDRLRRRYGKRIEYVRIFERHASGRFHMHILANTGLEYDKSSFVIRSKIDEFRHPESRWLSRACAELGGGWRVHIRRVWDDNTRRTNVGLVVGYILKYMGKDMASFEFPKHQRRIQTSRRIGSPATNAKGIGTWEHKREITLSQVIVSEKPIYDMSVDKVVTIKDFVGEHYYPPLECYTGATIYADRPS